MLEVDSIGDWLEPLWGIIVTTCLQVNIFFNVIIFRIRRHTTYICQIRVLPISQIHYMFN